MVRFVIAIACVSVLVPSSSAIAQSKTAGAKSAPVTSRGLPASGGKSAAGGLATRQVSRSQLSEEPSAAAAEGEPKAADGQGATVELKNDILKQQAPAMDPQLVKELDRILEFWSAASEDIQRLQGKHFRIVYDTAFEVEKQSEGEFAYEKADKGRIDIKPVQVTPQLIAARAKEGADAKAAKRRSQVRLKKDGTPFVLVLEQPEQWSCDGQRVYSVDMEKKEAVVANLPADMQGRNIMNSPLPFLFGLPPDKAKHRFTIFFTGSKFDPASGKAYLTIFPRLPQDAQSWRQADVILDLKEFLPVAVQLLDPAGTKITVYKFRDFKKNQKSLAEFLGGNPKTHFTPDLRDFQVQIIGDEKPPEISGKPDPKLAPGDAGEAALANVSGMKHDDAVKQLQRQGLKRLKGDQQANQIVLEAGPPATSPEQVFTVRSQEPAPGTPLKPGMKVKLSIWTDPTTSSN